MKKTILSLALLIASTASIAAHAQPPLTKDDLREFKVNEISSVIFQIFKGKYNMFAGDGTKASMFLRGFQKNGDGNEKIEGDESYQVWKHIRAARMINEKRFPVKQKAKNGLLTVGYDVPSTPLPNVGLFIEYLTLYEKEGHAITIGQPSIDKKLNNASLTPENALILDAGWDDGNPTTGKIVAKDGANTTGCIKDGKYNITNKDISCISIWWTR